MSKTVKGSKGPGFEYWKSRLKWRFDRPGKGIKRITAQRERANTKAAVRREASQRDGQ